MTACTRRDFRPRAGEATTQIELPPQAAVQEVMANFYALGDDLRSLLRFIYAETDIVVYELASEFIRDARQFASTRGLGVCVRPR